MKKHHIDRLEKLHAFLGTVKPKKFNFGSWAESKSGKADINVCGTTACALGWAGTMPEFRKRGLKLTWEVTHYDGEAEASADVFLLDDASGNSYVGEDAGAVFFGLSTEEAEYLFIPDGQSFNAGMGPSNMALSEYRQGLRKFINKKKRELGIK